MTMATLKTDIAGWMNRTDLATQTPGFIRIAESRIALDVRSWQMLELIQLTQLAGASSISVPVDWLEWDRLWIGGAPLDYVTPDVMQDAIRNSDPNGGNAWRGRYSMIGGELIVAGLIPTGAPAIVVAASYYQQIPPLVADTDTNWLLDTYPALYLYASLASACRYVKDEQRAGAYSDNYTNLLADISSVAIKSQHSGSQWRQRAR